MSAVLRRCIDASVADWFRETDWWLLVTQGPAGFESRVTVWFDSGDTEPYRNDSAVLARVVALAARFTSTPDDVLFAVWDGWGDPGEAVRYSTRRPSWWSRFVAERFRPGRFRAVPGLDGAAGASAPATLDLDGYRGFDLFRGPAEAMGAWGRPDDGDDSAPPAALVWPADRAWFIAADVDPVWFTVAGSQELIDVLVADASLVTRVAVYGEIPELEQWPQ